MNKKYMDFVPQGKKVKMPRAKVKEVVPSAAQRELAKVKEVVPSAAQRELAKVKAEPISRMPVLGKKVAKPEKASAKTSVAGAITGAGTVRAMTGSRASETVEGKKAMRIPKSPFVNTEKVTKRPLSKNVYVKEVTATSEISSGPVTIIDKPEKDSRVGLIVTIIITIILGAAAGTVAFLLLPK